METFVINNIKCIYYYKDSDVSCFNVFFKVGSYTENEKTVGISHFLEHLIMRNNKLKVLSDYGCDYNAITERNLTYYYFNTKTEYFEKLINVYCDLLNYKTTTKNKFEKEKEVVIQEIKNCNEMHECQYVDILENMIFKGNTLRYSTVGESDKLLPLKLNEVKTYFDKYYTRNNMLVTIVTKKSLNDIKNIIKNCSLNKLKLGEEIFGSPTTSLQEKENIYIDNRKKTKSFIYIGFLIQREDILILEIIKRILAGELHSRLYKDLRNKGYIYNISCEIECYEYIGNFRMSTSCDHKNLEKCIQIIWKNLYTLTKQEIDNKELRIIKLGLKNLKTITYDNPFDLSNFMGHQYIFNDEMNINNIIEKLDTITSKDIKRVASKYFIKSKMNIVTNIK